MYSIARKKPLALKSRSSHFYAQRFCLVTASDNTSIVVRENYDGLGNEVGPKHAFTGCKEIIAINEGNHTL